MRSQTKRRLLDSLFGSGFQISKYAVVGIANTLTDFGVFSVLFYALQMHPLWANVSAFSIAVSQSYVCNSIWTFKAKRMSFAKFFSFAAISLGGLFISSLSIFLLGGLISPLFAKLFAAVIVLAWGFGLSKTLIFKTKVNREFSSQSSL